MEDDKLISLALDICGLTELLEKSKSKYKQLKILEELERKTQELKEHLHTIMTKH